MIRVVLLLSCLLAGVCVPAAAEGPPERPAEGECAVCALRAGGHGVERYVDWREHDGEVYGFCSEDCAAAFDQMPAGYATPVLPRPAPQFRWTTLDGREITPGSDAALFVDFWATWCAPCLEAIPHLERLARDFADEGLRVVGVSIDEERETLDDWLERRPVGYDVVHDGGEDPAWWQFRVPAIPAAYLLNSDGEIVAQWNGTVEASAVREAVEAVLAGE